MPGRRGKNLRSGDLAEELGILLLKGIAAVAEVPRPEDVGFDGVATLLREGDSGFLYAEDSFYVQFKSVSVASIEYEGHEVEWLTNLKLPLFIGSVSSKESTISLYTTWRLSQIMIETKYHKLSLHLNAVDEKSEAPEQRVFNIGPPILSWGFVDLQSAEFRKRAYEMVKSVVEIETRNIRHRTVKHIESLQWVTNESVNSVASMLMSDESLTDVQILEAMSPYVAALTLRYIGTAGEDERDVRALAEMVQFFRRRGVSVSSVLGLGDWTRQLNNLPDNNL